MIVEDAPSETSPLLPKRTKVIPESAQAPSRIAPDGLVTDGHPEEDTTSIDEEQGQSNGKDRNKEHQGLPQIFLSAGDQTLIVSSYGVIGSDLKALNQTSWIATSYFLTLTSFQPLYGKLSDIFGRKSALLFAYAVFGLGCLFCGLARNMGELIVARMLAGIGGGGMTTVVSIMMSDIVTLRERGVWQGIVNVIYASGAGCGAPLGGVLADTIGWRWAFLGQVPLCALAFVVVAYVLQLPQADSSHWKTKLKRVDFLGAFVLVCAVATLLLGLDQGSNDSWKAPVTIASLCMSPLLFLLFILIELRIAAESFAPGRIVFEKNLVACYLCNFFSFGGWLALLFYLPLFFQACDDLTAAQAGIRLLPGVVAGVSGSLFGGLVMKRTGKYYWLTLGAFIFLALGMLPIVLCSGLATNNTYGISVGLVVGGFSNGVGVTTSLVSLIANAAQEDQAIATACSYLFRSLGSVVGVSLTAAVVQQSLRKQLQKRLSSSDEAATIVSKVRESLDYLNMLDPATREIVRQCYGHATTAGFGLMMTLAFFAAISS
ncbi:MAG: hypothetical protein Q9203_004961, partial [Teloschistes exilis]